MGKKIYSIFFVQSVLLNLELFWIRICRLPQAYNSVSFSISRWNFKCVEILNACHIVIHATHIGEDNVCVCVCLRFEPWTADSFFVTCHSQNTIYKIH